MIDLYVFKRNNKLDENKFRFRKTRNIIENKNIDQNNNNKYILRKLQHNQIKFMNLRKQESKAEFILFFYYIN